MKFTEFSEFGESWQNLKGTRNWYQSTCSSGKFFFTTTSRNVTVVTCRISLITILFLDFVMILWIRWCCDLTFHVFRSLIPNLEHLYIIEVLTHANATSMFKRLQMFTLIIMMPLQFKLSQSSSNSWHERQTCQLALTLVTTEIMIWQKC